MLGYRRTTKRRYMWGMGVTCSLLFFVITLSWAIEGRIGYRFRTSGGHTTGEIRRAESPALFWSLTGFGVAAGFVSVVVTAIGFSKVQRDEDKPVA